MPAGCDPRKIMADAMNPGLGIRALHKQGITGKGVTVAIIDYLFSANIGPAYALGTILILLVLTAIVLANRLLGRRMSQMFKMV